MPIRRKAHLEILFSHGQVRTDQPEKMAIYTTFVFNLLAVSIQRGWLDGDNSRIITDFLQNTCVPLNEVESYPNYYMSEHTPLIEKNFKRVSAEVRA